MEFLIGALFLIVPFFMYNSLVGRKNNVENAFSDIDTFLKQRYDQIPNILKIAKSVMGHEKEVFTKLAELRNRAIGGNLSSDEAVNLDNQISGLMSGLRLTVEAYPELRSNENFLMAQRTLNNVEANLNAARRSFNAAVTDYNNGVEMFPTNFIARMIGYKRKTLFVIPEEQRENIDVNDVLSA